MAMNSFSEKVPGLYYLNEDGGDIIWLIPGETSALLVDTGFGKYDLTAKVREITDKPLILVNTHLHPDHALGNGQFSRAYCSPADLPLLSWLRQMNPDFLGSCEMIPVQERYRFDLGGSTIEVIDVPGHTPGSIGLLWVERRILLIGDAANEQIWMHLNHSTPLSMFAETMQKLAGMTDRFDVLYTSHGESGITYTPDLFEKLAARAYAVARGEKTGAPAKMHLGHEAMLYMEDGVGFYYNPQNLTPTN